MRFDRDGLRWLIALALLINCLVLGSNRALTDHEVHLAATARQMVESGDWLVPRIGDHTWLEKPPLPQWLAAATAIAFGTFDEWTVRLPFALCGVVVVLLVAQIGTTLFGPRVGFVCGLIQATCVYQVTYSRLAESDVLLQCFVLGALAVFLAREMRPTSPDREGGVLPFSSSSEPLRDGRGWSDRGLVLAFWILLGCTNLSKGIAFGAVLTLVTCAGWAVLGLGDKPVTGTLKMARRWWSLPGLLLAALIAAAWPTAVVLYEPEALELWRQHLVERAAGNFGYTQPWWYYCTTWPTQLLPWTPFVFVWASGAASALRPGGRDEDTAGSRRAARPEGFCLWWVLSQAALLSCSSGKHHHYLIYALPGLTPLMAIGVLRCVDAWWSERWRVVALRTAFGIAVVGHLAVQLFVMPNRDPSRADKQFLAEVDRVTERAIPLAACGSQEISRHLFYVQRPVIGIWDVHDIPAALPAAGAVYVIARGFAANDLAAWGEVTQVAQSAFTRRERSPDDRYTLFLVRREAALADLPTTAASE